MPIKTLEEIQEQIAIAKTQISDLKAESRFNRTAALFTIVICIALGAIFIKEQGRGMNPIFAIIIIGLTAVWSYKKMLPQNSYRMENYYKELSGVLSLLFANHFPEFEREQDVLKKLTFVNRTKFFLKYTNLDLVNNFFYSGIINQYKIECFQYDRKTVLISISGYKLLVINDFYICKKQLALAAVLKLSKPQKFDYFPELARYFDFYTEQKGETAQFLQANEDIFVQMTKFTKYNLAITFINNQVHCLLRGVNMDLLADVDYEVNLDDKEIADYFQQLEELSNFINLLQQIK